MYDVIYEWYLVTGSSHTCTCLPGYSPDPDTGLCQDQDECSAPDQCHAQDRTVNRMKFPLKAPY